MNFNPLKRYRVNSLGCAPFILKTTDIPADILVRLRSNLCLWTALPEYSGKGRPRKHGNKFKLNEPDSWQQAKTEQTLNDPKLRLVKIRLWENLQTNAKYNLLLNI
jgi:hypothetical protein